VMGCCGSSTRGYGFASTSRKSAVDLAWNRKILATHFGAPGKTVKRRVASKALATMKECVRLITRRSGGRSIEQVCERLGEYLCGWKEYFRLADTPRILADLDEWIRHRLRAIHLKHWNGHDHLPRTACSGLPQHAAATVAATQALVEELGRNLITWPFPSATSPTGCPPAGRVTSTSRTARCGPARRVVLAGVLEDHSRPLADAGPARRLQ